MLTAIYRVLISLKLAVILILLLMAVLIAGTIIESRCGVEAARVLIYDAPFFSILLTLLGANVFTVTLSRWPWKKKHTGFLLTHLGILLILTGSVMTRRFMVDGQMIFQEGQTSDTISLSELQVELHERDGVSATVYKLPPQPFQWEGRRKLKSKTPAPFELSVLKFYPKARVKKSLEEASSGPGAIRVELHNDTMDESSWLVEGDPRSGTLNLGPAQITFAPDFIRPDAAAAKNEPMFVQFGLDGDQARVDLPADAVLPYRFQFQLAGKSYQGEILSVYRYAMVSGRELVEQSANENDWRNPAVRLTLQGPDSTEQHTAFANFPDFATIHNRPDASPVKVLFHAPHQDLPGAADHELRFVKNAEGKLFYQLKNKDQLVEKEVVAGQPIETGWMGLSVKPAVFYRHAREADNYEPKANTATGEGLTTAMLLEMAAGGGRETFWMSIGQTKWVSAGGKEYEIFFGPKRIPLGFAIRLKDFKKKDYPGTNKAASFESEVELIDMMRGERRNVTISMNEPLDYRGYKFYQSSFKSVPGQTEISVLSVGHDPGIPVKYAGAVIMVVGIIVMILMKKNAKRQEVMIR